MLLPLLLGAITGLALGLTGGGGTMLALPLMMLGLGVAAHEATAMALVAVGIMALVGALTRMRAHQLQWHLGLLFAAAGMAGAPLGTWIAGFLPATVVTWGFAVIAVVVAVRMWRRGHGPLPTDSAPLPPGALLRQASCRFDPTGRLRLTSQCLRLLIPAGLVTGVISGIFGVGGGFVVVPALVLIAGIDIRQATATSLLVVALVSLSGAGSAVLAGHHVDLRLTLWFAGGGILGLEAGSRLGRFSDPQIAQSGFAIVVILVAATLIFVSFDKGPS